MPSNFPLKSAGLIALAMTMIVGGDAAAKILVADGMSPFFAAWARFALGVVLILPFSGLRLSELKFLLNWRVILRAVLIVGGISSILTALKTEPMANVFGAFFVGPIVSYFLSALLLGEKITWMRTGLLAVCFAGVFMVVKPGFGMTSGIAMALLAGAFHGSYLVATRWLANDYRPRFLVISQLIIGAIVLLPLVATAPIPAFSNGFIWLISISALGSALGNLLIVRVNRTTPASAVAPMIYSQLLAATVIGFLVFNDWPDGLSLIGLVIILASGLSSFWLAGRGR